MDKSAHRRNQLSENLKRVRQERAEILRNWRDWLTQNHFDADLTPDGFLTFLGQMREARKELQFLETLRDRLARRNEYVSTLETKIRVLSGRVGLELSRENLPIIFRSLEEGLELAKQLAMSMEAKNTIDIECAVWEKALEAVQNDIRALCEEARVNSVAAFRSFVAECGKREAVEARLNEVRSILTGFLGAAGEVSAAGEADTSEMNVSDENKNGNKNGNNGESPAAYRNKAPRPRKWGPYEAELLGDALKQAEELEELRITVAERANTLEKLRAAYDILERRVLSPFSDERLAELERENAGLRAQAQNWLRSRLTVALARQFAERAAERAAPVPLILDDVLAQFDENRRHELIQALWQASGRVQIVLLTDQPFTARLIQRDLDREDGFTLLKM
jgi:uncharacterized protein YhaN